MTTLDLLIRNGRVLDGTGTPSRAAEVGIAAGKIAAVEPRLAPRKAGRILDAEGRVVCPGFIDTHSHDDAYLLINPFYDEKLTQGVTTVVTGNCGFTLAPASTEHFHELRQIAVILGADRLDPWEAWTFGDYLAALERARPGINVAPLVGHATVRMAVLGLENRHPGSAELNEMRRLTEEAMASGARGLSSGLIYFPAGYARTAEIVALAEVVSRYGGIYTTHLRSESDRQLEAIDEALAIGRSAGLPVHISHHKIVGRGNWGKSADTLRKISQARAAGLAVTCDQYPYNAGCTYLAAALPPHIQEKGPAVFAEKLRDPGVRETIIRELGSGGGGRGENLISRTGFESIVISTAPKHPHYIGRSIARIAESEARNPYDVFFDLLAEEKLDVAVILFGMDEGDILRIMQQPFTMIGTDGDPAFGKGKAHPRMRGTFPRVLGRYVREKGALTLEEAVRKMTSLPARTFGLARKGRLAAGYDADLVVFDPDTVIDRATYEDPDLKPEGISWVIVNGKVAVEEGESTRASRGRVLRSRGQPRAGA